MTVPHRIVTKQCENCHFVLSTKKRTGCPKCGGWLLIISPDAIAANPARAIVQALTPSDYLAAIKAAQKEQAI